MNKKVIIIGLVAAFAIGSISIATATPVIINGDFSVTDTNHALAGNQAQTVPAEMDDDDQNGGTYNGNQFVNGWMADGYNIWFPDETQATTVSAIGTWDSNGGTGAERLWGPGFETSDPIADTPPTGSSTFVGLDGDQADPGVQASIWQTVTNLTPGASYNISFYWAAGQLQSRNGATHSSLLVSFGDGPAQSTGMQDNPDSSFSGWWSASMNFTADSTSEVLKFLAAGTPDGLPPMSLLTGVSIRQNVPEPSELGLFGLGLFGLGLVTLGARRRALRRR